MNTFFSEKIEWFKSNEKPEVVLLIADDPQKIKFLIAWTNTTIQPVETPRPIEGGNENEIWQWLWSQVKFNPDEVCEKSSLSSLSFDKQLRFLIGNRLIYPDGTIHSFVQRYLRDKVLKLFEAKSARTSKKKLA